ncbi:MAG TPA: hypothetical protein VFU78_00250 [Thermomicrobiales bacterium]|nr:hypothetical protein [Thermomicrobiales bacterium]
MAVNPADESAAHAAARGQAPLSAEAKRRVRLADNARKGFETAWNEYFDCYASTTYVTRPLIRLEDIAYHLYLKKNINPTNPRWELPSFRQLKKILGLSQDKLQGIEERLGVAGLLVKESGVGKGSKGENVANDYVLYEPLEVTEFLLAVAEGRLPGELTEKGQRRLAEFRARFAAPADEVANGSKNGAIAAVPISGTGDAVSATTPQAGGVPESGTGVVPFSGTPGTPLAGTPPTPDSGTHNTPSATDDSQQTTRQHPALADSAADVVVATRDALVARGITPLAARRLVTAQAPDLIARQVEVFDFLRDTSPDDARLTPGRLRRMIEEDWAPPAGFISTAERAALAARQEQERQALAATRTAQAAADAARAAARQAQLAALGLTAADQVVWARLTATPAVPPFFRDALFHAPRDGAPAAVIFHDATALARATGSAHAAARTHLAARIADEWRRPGVPVHYLLFAEVARLVGDRG